ncbi:MAG TPA: ATP-binding protein [Terriglobales bacterium]|jgi:signal transduction histidine kinase
MPKTSIQRRLIAAVVISQLLLAVGLAFVAVYFTRRQLRQAFDGQLRGRAMTIAALVRYSAEAHPRLIFEDDLVPPPLEKQHPDLYRVLGSDGHLIARSPEWPSGFQPVPTKNRLHADFDLGGVPYRAVILPKLPVLDREPDIPPGDVLNVIYAAPTDDMARAVAFAGAGIAIGTAVLLLITVGLAVWGLRRSLRPLAELAGSASAISTSNWELNPSDAARNSTELAPLTHAMTTMLEGLHRAFDQQREFLANAAHELKTPVAILKSTLQSLLQRPRQAGEYRAGLEEALDDMARLEKLLHSMLRLARAEQWAAGSTRRDLDVIDIATTCQSAIDRLAPIARQRNIAIDVSSDGAMPLRADAEDLELVWANLVENAIRFSPDGNRIQIRLHTNASRGTVEIADNGPGMSPEELAHIFERFHRGDSSRARDTGGYGLGLAISKALVEAYGGSITPQSAPGRGTCMIVSLPLNG